MPKKNPAAVALGKRSGVNLTKKQRSERARRAIETRWRKTAAPKTEYELVLIPESLGQSEPVATGEIRVILRSPDWSEIIARSKQKDIQLSPFLYAYRIIHGDHATLVKNLDYDPKRYTIQTEYAPDTDAQLKALRTAHDADGGKS